MNIRNNLLVGFFLATSLWPLSSLAADPVEVEVFLEMGSCPGCDLSGASLDGVIAQVGDLSDANMRDASLYRATLGQANLSGADLTGANLTRALLDGADLSYAYLNGANLTGATLMGADTTGTLTDAFTICPDGSAGPCDLRESN